MVDISHPDFSDKLVARLAHKAGLSQEQAQKFLDALSDVTSGEVPEHNLPRHVISIPLVQKQDGTMIVDTSGYSAWVPLSKLRRTPAQQPSLSPTAEPNKPRQPPFPPGGAYPGPSVLIKVNDWLGADLKLGEGALGRLREALEKPRDPDSLKTASAPIRALKKN